MVLLYCDCKKCLFLIQSFTRATQKCIFHWLQKLYIMLEYSTKSIAGSVLTISLDFAKSRNSIITWMWWMSLIDYCNAINSLQLLVFAIYNAVCDCIETISLYPSHTGQADSKPTSNRQKSSNSGRDRFTVGIDRFCRFGVGLCSGRHMCRGEIFQTCLKDLSPTNYRLSVGYVSVWCRFCRGAFGDVSVLIRPPIVGGLSVLDRLCIGHMSADLTPIQGRFKTETSPT